MSTAQRRIGLLAWVLTVLALAACTAAPPAPKQTVGDDALSYDAAMRAISADLVQQLQAQSQASTTGVNAVISRVQSAVASRIPSQQAAPAAILVAVDPFIDAQNGYAVRIGEKMQDDLGTHLATAVKGARLMPLTSDSLARAQYVMSGAIGFEPHGSTRHYRVQVSLVDTKTGNVAAQSSAWLADRNLDMNALPIYQDSPVFITDRYTKGLVATARTPAGHAAERTYFSQLSTQALLSEAQQAFGANDPAAALSLYQRAATRPDGRTLKTYSGLYVTQLKLGNLADAERAFGDLIDVAFAENNLSIRFLFHVNSTEFIPEQRLAQQYRIWVRQLAQHIARNRACVDVQGHSSRTGNETYNDQLSLQRAEALRRLMQQEAPPTVQLTRATGRGFRDNLVGSGTDDARDAIDRRVDFKISPCPQGR